MTVKSIFVIDHWSLHGSLQGSHCYKCLSTVRHKIHTYLNAHVHDTNINTHMYLHSYIHRYTHIRAYIHTFIHTIQANLHRFPHTHTRKYTRTLTYISTTNTSTSFSALKYRPHTTIQRHSCGRKKWLKGIGWQAVVTRVSALVCGHVWAN